MEGFTRLIVITKSPALSGVGLSEDRRIELEENRSDLGMDELYEMFRHTALALGYHPNTVEEYLPGI